MAIRHPVGFAFGLTPPYGARMHSREVRMHS